ncbi:MAG: PilZ domain-containing protein [Desulfobacterales bacterium]|nr:PilZ domain-containing protein [Desulfobacterales bacterium]
MVEKVFITAKNTATFVCPKCHRTKTINVEKHETLSTADRVKVKCPCGHAYSAKLERRKQYRRETDLPGSFYHLRSGVKVDKGVLIVKDISRTGLKIKLNIKRPIDIDDKLLVEFHLDDNKRSLVKKEAVVRKISGLELGVEFTLVDPSDINDKMLGFYLFG